MNNVVRGYEVKIGDTVEVIDACMGAYGVNGRVGVVVSEEEVIGRTHGLMKHSPHIIVKVDGVYGKEFWRIGRAGRVKVKKKAKPIKKHIEIDVLIKGGKTKVVIGDKVGLAKHNEKVDDYNEAYGILLAVARALKLEEEKVQLIVDALYGDFKKSVNDFTLEEILESLRERI